MPIFLELAMVICVILVLYPPEFTGVILTAVVLYITATYCITEWRAKSFKKQATMDNEYVQKATDSLLNFETVKYFNAEKHEKDRFHHALQNYKVENIKVAYGL